MDDIETVCSTCRAPAEIGSIFCKKCGATLRPPVPLGLPPTQGGNRLPMRGEMNRRTPLAFFSIGAVVDFVFGLVKWHSVVAGIIAIACGLPLTGLLFLVFGASWKGNNSDSGASST